MPIEFHATVTFTVAVVLLFSAMTTAAEPDVSASSADTSDTDAKKPVADARRFQAVLIYGQTAILDRDTGKLVLIRPDMTTTVVIAPAAPAPSTETAAKASTKTKPAQPTNAAGQAVNAQPPASVTPELRAASEPVCARYVPKLGPICIASLSDSGVVADVVIRNSGDMILRAIEFTFRGRSDAGHIELQRIYVKEPDTEYDILPRPGERRQVRFKLSQLSASDIVMDVSYMMLGDKPDKRDSGN